MILGIKIRDLYVLLYPSMEPVRNFAGIILILSTLILLERIQLTM